MKAKKQLKHGLSILIAFVSYTATFGQYSINYPSDTVYLCPGETLSIGYTPTGIGGVSGDSIIFVKVNNGNINDSLYGVDSLVLVGNINGIIYGNLSMGGSMPLPQGQQIYLVKGTPALGPEAYFPTNFYDTIVIGGVIDSSTVYKIHHSNFPNVAPATYPEEPLCMVTVDTVTGKNQIIWEQTAPRAQAYKIFKLNDQTSQYDSIAIRSSDSLSIFVDENSNPAAQSASYKISVIDTVDITTTIHDTIIYSACSGGATVYNDTVYTHQYIGESPQSAIHKTILLQASIGTAEEVNLSWNLYTGFTYTTQSIYRSNNGGAWTLLQNVANSVTAYTDNTHPVGVNRYFVSVANPNGCNPSERTISSTLSNIYQYTSLTGVEEYLKEKISIFPNPFMDKLNVVPNIAYRLYNIIGQEVYRSESKTSVSQLPKGTYILKTETGVTTRVVKVEQK